MPDESEEYNFLLRKMHRMGANVRVISSVEHKKKLVIFTHEFLLEAP